MQPTTLRQRAYRRLHAKFLSGELVAGMTLTENQLAKELGMSRTPIREALESLAAAAAAQRISPDSLSKLDGLWGNMNEISLEFQQSGEPFLEGDLLRRYLASDLEFHQIVVDAAGNRYLSKIVNDTRLLVRVFTSTFWRYDREKLDESNRFHLRLLEALRCKDAEAARIATLEAMQVSRDNALRAWNQHVAPALEANKN